MVLAALRVARMSSRGSGSGGGGGGGGVEGSGRSDSGSGAWMAGKQSSDDGTMEGSGDADSAKGANDGPFLLPPLVVQLVAARYGEDYGTFVQRATAAQGGESAVERAVVAGQGGAPGTPGGERKPAGSGSANSGVGVAIPSLSRCVAVMPLGELIG